MSDSYRKIKRKGRTLYAHRVLVEERLGRPLTGREVVHHKNGDKGDNAPDNLEVTTAREHARHHMLRHPIVKSCAVCGRDFEPMPSHRPRDRSCSSSCRDVLIMRTRLGARFQDLDIADIRASSRHESLRSVGRRYGVSHTTISRILKWPPPLAEAVGRAIRKAMDLG